MKGVAFVLESLRLRDRGFLWVSRLLDALYPRRCVLCGELLPLDNPSLHLCQNCAQDIPFLSGRLCPHCGAPLQMTDAIYCHRCAKGHQDRFDHGFAAFPYNRVRQGIFLLKYRCVKGNGGVLAGLMHAFLMREHPHALDRVDGIVPVPLHPKRQQGRGFNQAALLAEGLSRRTGIPCLDILERIKETLPQSSLSLEERRKNLIHAFRVKPDTEVQGKRFLVVDDIFTTGATVNDCARALREQGASQVLFFTLAITEKPNPQ